MCHKIKDDDEFTIKRNLKSELNADDIWEVAWTYIRTVVDTLREPFLILDENLQIISANKTFYSFFQVKPEETEGKRVYDLGNGQWNIRKLKILLEDILPKNILATFSCLRRVYRYDPLFLE